MIYFVCTVFVLGLVFLYYSRYKKQLIQQLLPFVELESKHSGKIRAITYNIAGLPQLISSANTPRKVSIELIGEKLSQYDIVNVQEDFNYNSSLYAHNTLPYRTMHKGKVPFGDGLNTLSKYPIIEYRRIPWRDCRGSDCLTPKGFSYTKIALASDVTIDVYNVHANSLDHNKAATARRKNLLQLAQYIHDHSMGRPLLVMGDFNAHYAFQLDNLHEFLKLTQLTDSWISHYRNNEFPLIDPCFVAKDMLSLSDDDESLDKILFRNSENFTFFPTQYAVEVNKFVNSENAPLSDHLAVSICFNWHYTSV